MTAEIGVLVIGGGAVGLSIARAIAKRAGFGRSILLLERHAKVGWESSSHNSEVIHASVYYPRNSLKATLCSRGNDLMYKICTEYGIPHKKMGKLLVPRNAEEVRLLPRMLRTAIDSGGKGLRLVNKDEIKDLEPHVEALAAIYCPTTGLVDSHALVKHYEDQFLRHGGDIAFHSEVVGIRKYKGIPAYEVDTEEVDLDSDPRQRKVKARLTIQARCVINAAGMASGKISALAGIDLDQANYRLHCTVGKYVRVHPREIDKYPQNVLVYPLPVHGAVGVHTCPDLAGGMRLGPLETWLSSPKDSTDDDFNHPDNRSYYGNVDLRVEEELLATFAESVRPFLPYVTVESLSPESAGIHSKLQSPEEEGMRDWVIKHEKERGLENFFNLVGIESPGLTASAAIGDYVADLVQAEAK